MNGSWDKRYPQPRWSPPRARSPMLYSLKETSAYCRSPEPFRQHRSFFHDPALFCPSNISVRCQFSGYVISDASRRMHSDPCSQGIAATLERPLTSGHTWIPPTSGNSSEGSVGPPWQRSRTGRTGVTARCVPPWRPRAAERRPPALPSRADLWYRDATKRKVIGALPGFGTTSGRRVEDGKRSCELIM